MGGFPALMIQQPESPLKQFGEAMQIKAGIQESQIREIQLQEARDAQAGSHALMEAFTRNKGDLNATYADAVNSGKVPPEMLIKFRTDSVTMQTQAATLTEKELANHAKMLDMGMNEFESLKGITDENQFQSSLKDSVSRLLNAGADPKTVLPFAQSLAQDHSPSGFKSVETSMMGPKWVFDTEKQAREQRQAPTDAEAEAQRQATLSKTVADTNKAVQDTSLAAEHQRQLGKVTDLEVYKQQQENYRAALSRQASFANQLQKNGLEQLDKMFADPQHGYTNFLAQAQSTKSTIMQARNGNELASSLEPLMIALGVTSFAGVHRINQTEVNAAGPHAGSLYRQLDSMISKAGSGSIPEDTLKEATAIVDGLIDAKHESMLNAAHMVAANGGLDPQKTMVMDRSGVITSLDKAGEGNQRHVEPTSPAVPANVSAALAKAAAGRHTLSDGSVWDKREDGSLVKVQ